MEIFEQIANTFSQQVEILGTNEALHILVMFGMQTLSSVILLILLCVRFVQHIIEGFHLWCGMGRYNKGEECRDTIAEEE